MLDVLERAEPSDEPVKPELLLTQSEWEQVKAHLATAGKPMEEVTL